MLDPLFTLSRRRLPLFAPDDAGGDPPAAAEAAPAAEAPTPVAETPSTPETPAETPPAASRWWDDKRFSAEERRTIEATGLTVDDPLDALKELSRRELAAKKRLGASPDSLIAKPTAEQSPAEWRRAHAEDLGIPETAADYKIDRPEGWPEGIPWDDKLEQGARALAEKHAADPALVQDIANLYAARVKETSEQVDGEIERARTDMMTELERDWGDKLDGNLLRAELAMKAAAEAAGLDQSAIRELTMVLEKKTGAANVMRLFAAIGDGMGEDTLTGAGNAPSLSNTPAEARAKIAEMTGPEGAWFKATKDGNQAEIKRLKPMMDDLYKRAAR